jgi:hypothetical protein
VIAVAAAEAAVGLRIILAFFRNKETVNIDRDESDAVVIVDCRSGDCRSVVLHVLIGSIAQLIDNQKSKIGNGLYLANPSAPRLRRRD